MDNKPAQTAPRQHIPPPVSFPAGPPINPKHANRLVFGYLALIIAAAALGGMYVWQHTKVNDADTKVSSLQSQVTSLKSQVSKLSKAEASASAALSQATDPTANWASYTSQDSKFTLKYPSSWVLENTTGCTSTQDNQFGIGPTSSSAGSCKALTTPEISVLDTAHACLPLVSAGYTTTQATVAGLSVKEYSGVSNGTPAETNAIGILGTKYIEYCIPSSTDPNLVYKATYIQTPSYPDASTDFNLMITKTLSFN